MQFKKCIVCGSEFKSNLDYVRICFNCDGIKEVDKRFN